MTGTLIDQIKPRQSYLRAANLELHQEQVEHYIPTGRALEVLRRLVEAIEDPSAGRAWSLTGPYGAGKSSFALFLRALLGPASLRRSQAEATLGDADAPLLAGLRKVREGLGAEESGFVLATTTCQQEPLIDSLVRALEHGVSGYWTAEPGAGVGKAIEAARAARSARTVATAVKKIAAHAPVLLILDEFGKTLEHFASAAHGEQAGADLFALQELAELATGSGATPSFIFTLQHLAFDDYVRQASAAQRREWGKVQGRFEDVPFLESAEQSLRLVAGALEDASLSPSLRKRRSTWAMHAYERATDVGVANHLPGGADTLEHCYPLHPIALLALPELCAQLGQHGRTLFTFLASTEDHTARAFLAQTPIPGARVNLPSMQLAELYDFFAGPGQAMAAGIGGNRWREVNERIREASSLASEDVAVLKTVGLLNLMGNVVGLRASADLISYALAPADASPDATWRERLSDLEARGWLTYRSFADEYRLWQGSDVDLRGRVADAREQLRSTSAAELLTRLQAEQPLIAGRHSQRVTMLRYFSVAYSDGSAPLPVLGHNDPADGLLVYFLGAPESAATLRASMGARPTVVACSAQAELVRDAAVEAASALAVLDQQEVMDDRVARRELQDRVADARSRLNQTFTETFRPGAEGVDFWLLNESSLGKLLPSTNSLSRLLSDVCDSAYDKSPEIKNEMLGRRDLTSQGAKARRNLIQAMIAHRDDEQLGFENYGPERSMYEAVLRFTGVHREYGGTWDFSPPKAESNLSRVWGTMSQFVDSSTEEPAGIDELYRRLAAPPIGLKDGPIPVLLTAFLLHRDQEVAIYEDGSYQPALTIDLMERLIKAPRRFALKSFSTAGARSRQLSAISDATTKLQGAGKSLSMNLLRNRTVLAVAAPLLRLARGLPDYTLHTTALESNTIAVRAALLEAREPDRLLFEGLPAACGIDIDNRTRAINDADLPLFVGRLQRALDELQGAYDDQLRKIGSAVAAELEQPDDLAKLRPALQHRAQSLEEKVINPRLRTFLFNAANDTDSDTAWLSSMGLAVSDKPVELWRDEDRTRYAHNLRELVAAFRRVEALHYDAEARDSSPFMARRMAITTPEGQESNRVVYYTQEMLDDLRPLAEELLRQAEERVGPQGRDGLAALVADLVLNTADQPSLTKTDVPSTQQRKANNA